MRRCFSAIGVSELLRQRPYYSGRGTAMHQGRDAWPTAPCRPKSRPVRPALPINAAALQPSSLLLGVACGTGAAFCWAAGFVAARHGILAGLAPADIALHRF